MERAIQTFKNHFVACLCTTDKHFPIHLWDRILPQATTTLNLLHSSQLNLRLSAKVHLDGTFNFNCTPLSPLGTLVIGCDNLADYYTKHHSPVHHLIMCPTILHEPSSVQTRIQQGCVESPSQGDSTQRLVRPPIVGQLHPSCTAITSTQQYTRRSP